ncbi:unnamed protein product [Rangifer tarandus platyrhynchus]|uniref:Uncharacterized protein n=2 Tax=Rangifer tarandus platyrhynchus TaxID=3082113 RepID=A0ABN8ZHR6_RANTA|nr:unnamed protein product [Rangifer tarandus platyrhynchus]CAI9707544.1 unnamed protein product [Rangifer tarandus platyrhynchus]
MRLQGLTPDEVVSWCRLCLDSVVERSFLSLEGPEGTRIASQCWSGAPPCLLKFRAHSRHSLPWRMVWGGGAVTPASRRGPPGAQLTGGKVTRGPKALRTLHLLVHAGRDACWCGRDSESKDRGPFASCSRASSTDRSRTFSTFLQEEEKSSRFTDIARLSSCPFGRRGPESEGFRGGRLPPSPRSEGPQAQRLEPFGLEFRDADAPQGDQSRCLESALPWRALR